jgi:Cupin domain
VLEVGKRYTSPRTGTWLEVIGRADGNMKFERSLAPGTGRTDPHLHEDLTQTWEALSGEGMIEVDASEREFRTGDRVAISPGTPHRDPWNPPPHRERPPQRPGRAAAAADLRHLTGDEWALLGGLAGGWDTEGRVAADGGNRAAARL